MGALAKTAADFLCKCEEMRTLCKKMQNNVEKRNKRRYNQVKETDNLQRCA
jgi:hypothetical protein